MSLKQHIINDIIAREGGYVNNPDDAGGETNWGITLHVARTNGYHGTLRDMPREFAVAVYEKKYWLALSLTQIESMSEHLAAEIADTGVNLGTHRIAVFLQRALNVLNLRGSLYEDLTVDGDIGANTLRALSEFLAYRESGETVLLRMLNALQGEFYISLTERREKDETFIYGWFNNRIA